jgi:hypothetical protein
MKEFRKRRESKRANLMRFQRYWDLILICPKLYPRENYPKKWKY